MNSDPELCRRVAEACGCELSNSVLWCPPDLPNCWWDGERFVHCEVKTIPDLKGRGFNLVTGIPPFDCDWNLAMWAAERFGLLKKLAAVSSYGPRAICLAIDKLADA